MLSVATTLCLCMYARLTTLLNTFGCPYCSIHLPLAPLLAGVLLLFLFLCCPSIFHPLPLPFLCFASSPAAIIVLILLCACLSVPDGHVAASTDWNASNVGRLRTEQSTSSARCGPVASSWVQSGTCARRCCRGRRLLDTLLLSSLLLLLLLFLLLGWPP